MSKGRSKGNHPATQSKESGSGKGPSRQEIYEQISEKEFKRLKRCLRKATEHLLADAEGHHENRLYETVSDFVHELVEILWEDLVRGFPLFEETKGKANWEHYLAGLRGLFRDFRHSHVLGTILPLLGLKELGEKTSAYSQESLELLHLLEAVFNELDKYVDARVRAAEIAANYGVESERLQTLYASLKAWGKDEDFSHFVEDFKALLDMSIEVIIEGPIHLYLMLSRQGFLLIFKSLMMRRLVDRDLTDEDLNSLMALHDEVHSRIEGSEGNKIFQALTKKATEEYLRDWREEAEELRALFPTLELKEAFIERFERGVIFGKEEES